ncbi:MAG TPA: hypothetical protein VK879_05035 [Candidatus Sulfomarinibacteraceae bacterium]|nr:hypothetical protein [Candidatus Sulfomarinibacteraceae bacterium]
MKIRFFFLFLAVLLFTVACAGQPPEETAAPPSVTATRDEPAAAISATPTSTATSLTDTSPTDAPSPTTGADREARLTPQPTGLPDLVPTPVPETPVTSEAPPELVEEMMADLARRLDVPVEQITVLRAEEVVWPDGALGCPQPGEVYTQALVPGYRVTLIVDDRAHNYHANRSGYFILCEQMVPDVGPPAGTPTD